MKKALTYITIIGLACVAALNYNLFVFPNNFAPAGLNGICTMVQHLLGISIGYLNLLINIPLALLVFFRVSKILATRSLVYVLSFSAIILLLENLDLSQFAYATPNGTSTILGPLVAGVIYGTCNSLLVRICAYSGGTDFVAALIHKSRPDMNFFWITFVLNAVVAGASFFVYGMQIEPVILCVLYSFMSSTVSDRSIKTGRSAVRFEIITEHPQEISQAIIQKLHHSATLMPAKGMYSGKETNVLVCIVNRSQVAALAEVVRSYPKSFAILSTVNQVYGNFKFLKNDGKEENKILDSGDVSAV